MVVFTCQNCGESVKKNAAENHKFKCCRDLYLTCVDCLKDFRRDEYKAHISCVTEAERYGGKDYVAKPVARKQNEWLEICQSVLEAEKLGVKQRRLLELCSGFNNVPRNENKFVNFIRNIGQDMRNDTELAKSVFGLISSAYRKRKDSSKNKENEKNGVEEDVSGGGASNENGNVDGAEKKTKKEKKNRKREADEDGNGEKASETCELSKKERKRLRKLAQRDGGGGGGDAEPADGGKTKTRPESEEDDNRDGDKEDSGGEKVAVGRYDGLSKKERKRKMKRERYEAEIESIENYQRGEMENGDEAEGGATERKKKKKKKKTVDVVGGDELETDDRKAEKRKKSDTENNSLPCHENGAVDDAAADAPTGKFDWSATIVKLLESSADGEMSLKRLCKRAVAEYRFRNGSTDAYEKSVAKFNKRVLKTVGVRVVKDNAKLIR